jgi:membrane protein implicated in regulation of membrane protease activity
MYSLLIIAAVLIILLFVENQDAAAYIGPGAGIAAIGTVLAFIAAIILSIIAFLWYPIKRMLKKFKRNRKAVQE